METTTNQSIKIESETDIYYGYVCPIIGIIGVFLNMIVFAIFSSSIFKEILYKYLKLQALFIAMDLLFTSFRPLYYWKHCEISHSYVAHLYEKYLITYGASVVEMGAFVCLVLATLNYYLLIGSVMSAKRFFLARVSYIYVTFVVVVVSIVLFLYQLFEYKIVCGDMVLVSADHSRNTTKWICDIEYEPFHYSTFHSINEIFAFFVRDGLNLIILVVLNVMLFVRVKKGIKKKKMMLHKANTNSSLTSDSKVPAAENLNRTESRRRMRSISKTKYKLTVMVILSSVNCALGRLPIMIFFIIRNFEEENYALLYFRKLAVVCVYLSYDFNFFFLYFTNKKFKMLFNQHVMFFFTCRTRTQSIQDRSVTMDW